MNLTVLREQTREQHEAVEAMLPFTDPRLSRFSYEQLLQWFYRVVEGWETWSAQHVPPQLAELVRERRRAPLLLADLQFFGLPPLESEGTQPAFATEFAASDRSSPEFAAGFLGAMYVMEGSTLGGQYIARHVEQVLGLQPGHGDAYFRGYGERTGALWNAFREVLSDVPEEHTPLVTAAAKATFAYVEETMRTCPAVTAAMHPAR